MQRRTDRLLAQALGHALQGPSSGHDPAVELALVAGGDEWPVREALARVRRANRERPSGVARRAEATLLAVLQVVTGRREPRTGPTLDLTEVG